MAWTGYEGRWHGLGMREGGVDRAVSGFGLYLCWFDPFIHQWLLFFEEERSH